ncbi:MAG: hypothetical protein WCX12_01315 [Candidatus Paceibacterota bacterium]|jgi:hypothetical protein
MPILSGPKKLIWTTHSRAKMRYYGISEQRTKRVLNMPKRIEEGIAMKTIAMMQSAGSKKHPYEIWVMLQEEKNQRKIISVWRFPGITKPGAPIPEEVIAEIKNLI